MKTLLLLLLFAFVATSAFAENVTFIGTGAAAKYSDPKNWSNGKVPGANDNVKVPTGSYMVVDANVRVNSIENNGTIYTNETEENKTIQANSFVNNNRMIIGESFIIFKHADGSQTPNWTNNGQINGDDNFAIGVWNEEFKGSVVNNGTIDCNAVAVDADNFTNGKQGKISTNGSILILTEKNADNQGNLTSSMKGNSSGFASIMINSKGDVNNSGKVSTTDKEYNGRAGTINLIGNNIDNSGDIIAGDSRGLYEGGKIEITAKDELKTSGSIITGNGDGAGTAGELKIHAKSINIEGGTLKLGKPGSSATYSGYMYLVAQSIKHYGWFPSSKVQTGNTGKSWSVAADDDAPFPVYFHAKDITYSGTKDAADVQHITFNCENIVFKDMESDALKSFGYVTIQYKEGGSADFSQLINPNSITTQSQIQITNSNIIEPPGGFLSVFNVEPTLVDPVNGWDFITEIVNINQTDAGLSSEISFDLFNMYFLEQEVKVNFRSENGWTETSSITIDIDYLSFGNVIVPFTVPEDAQSGDTDKFYYSFTYGGQTTDEIEMELRCLGSKAIDAPALVALESPLNSATDIEISPTLTWEPTQDADFYMIEFATDDQFDNVLLRLIVDDPTLLIDMELEENTEYFWHVYAANNGGFGPWSDTWKFTTLTKTSVEDNSEELLVDVYPNPATNLIIFNINRQDHKEYTLEISDAAGKIISTIAGNDSLIEYPTSNLQSGVYFYRLSIDGKEKFGKFVVK
jgi:hypothetical protein